MDVQEIQVHHGLLTESINNKGIILKICSPAALVTNLS